ncbi:hypothetical protein F2Q69_00015960 [Brassica cretica]|uniref:Reverse transcriptase zinc-binding domain-containing protein n=1 Tax=Brassica cretica TaxID=69181 RepID=A0A8S9R379_BRACR|nr:hypothetical protein F2Q69_00015960 [Brassica cretica]
MLFFKAGSVWVAWFRDEVLNGDISNYWTIQPSRKHSWLANKLLKLRSEVYPWIKLRVRDGRTCKFWVENWSPFGNLQVFLNPHGNSRLGIAKTATLASLCRNGVWCLPNARSDNQLQFLTFLTTFQLQDGDDYYEWELQGRISNRYSTGEVYRLLRGDQPVTQPVSYVLLSLNPGTISSSTAVSPSEFGRPYPVDALFKLYLTGTKPSYN